MSYSTEIINLGVLTTIVTSPSQRDFVFDFDFEGFNVLTVNTGVPQFVKTGSSTAPTMNGHIVANNNIFLDDDNTASFSTIISVSSSGSTYNQTTNVRHNFYIDVIYNKILLTLDVVGSPTLPNVPIWCYYTFRGRAI